MSKSSSSGTAIDRVVRAVVAPWFRQQGFRRKGRFFSRAWADVIHAASLQASQWNTPQSAEFYVNIDVEWSACHRLWTGSANNSNPAHVPCFLRSRLQTAGGDQSWNAFQDVEVGEGPDRLQRARTLCGRSSGYAMCRAASTRTSRCSASPRRLQPIRTLGKSSTRMGPSCFASTSGAPTSIPP